MKTPFRLHRNVVKQAGRAGSMANLRRRRRRLTAVNAVQPVSMLVVGNVEVDFIWADGAGKNPGIGSH